MNHAVAVPVAVEVITKDVEVLRASKANSVGNLLEITIPVSPETPLRVKVPAKVGLGSGLAALGGKKTTAVEPVGIDTVVAPTINATETVWVIAAAVVIVIGPNDRAPSSPPVTFAAMVRFPEAAMVSPLEFH